MKASAAFVFFLLFLAGLAFVNLYDMRGSADSIVTTPEQLVDVAWRPIRLGEMAIEEDTTMFLQFNEDGRVIGHAGCNRLFGSYRFEDGQLMFGMIGATRMACGEPTDSFEISFLQALDSTRSGARVDSRLALRDADGETVVRFLSMDRIDN
ncbi:MAG: META domain-containing protein [Gammaproteobacteria bacterium]|nr:META domain-containing protein [Gammaproteobacteria bacterium]MDH5346064.1 META domain-containing protein [Gammaproteobacteria bacterium]